MAKINKYQIDWVNDDTSQIPTKADGPDFWADIWKAGRKDTIFAEFGDAFSFAQSIDELTDYIDEDEWNEKNFYYRKNADGTNAINWFPGMTRTDARLLAETYDDDYDYAVKQSQVSSGAQTVNEVLRMGVSMFADETNLIPFGIGVNGFKALSKVPKLYKSIMAGAATTAAYSTAEQFLIYPQAEWNRRQREVTLGEQFKNIGLATVVGGAFGGAGSKVGDFINNRAIKKRELQAKENANIQQTKNEIETKLNETTEEIEITTIEHDRIDSAPDDLENIVINVDTVGVRDVNIYNKDGQKINTPMRTEVVEALTYKNAEEYWNATKGPNSPEWKNLAPELKKKISKSYNKLKKIDEIKGRTRKAQKIKGEMMVEISRGADGMIELKIHQKVNTQKILQMIVDNLKEEKIRIIYNSANKRKRQQFEFTRTQILDNLSEVLRTVGTTRHAAREPIQPTVRLYKGTDGTQMLVYENRYDGSKNIILQNADGNFKGGEVLSKAETTMVLKFIEDKNFAGLKKFMRARKKEQEGQVDDIRTQDEEVPEFEVVNENIVATKKSHDEKIDNIVNDTDIDALDNLAQASGTKNADIDAVRNNQTTRKPTTDETRANPDAVDTDLTLIKEVNDNLNVQKSTMQKLKDKLPKYIACKIKNIARWR